MKSKLGILYSRSFYVLIFLPTVLLSVCFLGGVISLVCGYGYNFLLPVFVSSILWGFFVNSVILFRLTKEIITLNEKLSGIQAYEDAKSKDTIENT